VKFVTYVSDFYLCYLPESDDALPPRSSLFVGFSEYFEQSSVWYSAVECFVMNS